MPGATPPTVYLSISSLRALGTLQAHLETLETLQPEAVLISSLDLSDLREGRKEALSLLSSLIARGTVVVIDSGGYEAYWMKRSDWEEEHHWAIVGEVSGSQAMGFDHPSMLNSAADAAAAALAGINGRPPTCHVAIPIVHALGDALREAVVTVAEDDSAGLIAVAERNLGDGLVERLRTVIQIRSDLDARGRGHVGLHILGAGSPLDVLCYSWAGASSLDGLEWSRYLLDTDGLACRGSTEWELIRETESFGDDEIPYVHGMWAHNALRMRELVTDIRRGGRDFMTARLAACRPQLLDRILAI